MSTGIKLGRAVGTGTIKDATGIAPGTLLIGSESIVEIDSCLTCKATAKFSAVLSAPPTANYTVKYSTQDTGATAGLDYTARSNISLGFTAGGAIQKAITVVTLGDTLLSDGTGQVEGINVVFTSPSTPTAARQRQHGSRLHLGQRLADHAIAVSKTAIGPGLPSGPIAVSSFRAVSCGLDRTPRGA